MDLGKRKNYLTSSRQYLYWKESNFTSPRTLSTNEDYTVVSPNSLLQKLKNRKIKPELQLAPQLAKRITKQFIHGLISLYSRNPMISPQSSLPLITHKKNTQSILMCRTIEAQLKSIKVEIQSKNQKLELMKLAIKREKGLQQTFRQKKNKAQILLKILKQELEQNEKSHQIKQVCKPLLNYRVSHFQKKLKDSQQIKAKICRVFSEQSLLNESLRMDTIELIHQNSILYMLNSITGERLKGLWISSQQLSDQHLLISIKKQRNLQAYMASEVCEQNSAGLRTIRILFDLNFNALQSNQQRTFVRHTMMAQIKRVKIYTKDHIHRLTRSLKTAKHQTKRKKNAFKVLEQKFNQLTTLYNRARKSSRLRINRKNSEKTEKLCKRCNILYTEARNYNFSCSYHPSEWSGTMYWCCGSLLKNSRGCTQSKHDSIDKIVTSQDKRRLFKCTSCLQYGHTSFTCPKDPNIRSRADSADQLQRLSYLKYENKRKKKRRPTLPSLEPVLEEQVKRDDEHIKQIESGKITELQPSRTYSEAIFQDPLFLVPGEFHFNSKILTKSRGTFN